MKKSHKSAVFKPMKPLNCEEMAWMLTYSPDFTTIVIDNGHSYPLPGRILEIRPIACVFLAVKGQCFLEFDCLDEW